MFEIPCLIDSFTYVLSAWSHCACHASTLFMPLWSIQSTGLRLSHKYEPFQHTGSSMHVLEAVHIIQNNSI